MTRPALHPILAAVWLSSALCACGSDSGAGMSLPDGGGDAAMSTPTPTSKPTSTEERLGGDGGTIVDPGGARIVVPEGALEGDVEIAITQTSAGAPPLPKGVIGFGPMFAFTPHGIAFAEPVTATVPFDAEQVPAGTALTLYKTNAAQDGWIALEDAVRGDASMSAQVDTFSFFVVAGQPGVAREIPIRAWRFFEFPSEGGVVPVTEERTEELGDTVNDSFDYGPQSFAVGEGDDGTAFGKVFSSADGMRYSVLAEGPRRALGNQVVFVQNQGFKKIARDAQLKLVVTKVLLQGIDFQPTDIIRFECSADPLCKLELSASVEIQIEAYSRREPGLWDGHARVELRHIATFLDPAGSPRWALNATNLLGNAIWQPEDFVLKGEAEHVSEVVLVETLSIPIDLSGLEVGDEFSLGVRVVARTFNEAGGESYVSAYFRDPVEGEGGALEYSGLALVAPFERPEETPPPDDCGEGADAEAGVLQFGEAEYAALELPISGQRPIAVTRTGGSRGAVSVVIRSGGGSAQVGADYEAVEQTVRFADGESAPRTVDLAIVHDDEPEPDETLELTLAGPRGCAALGARDSALFTIIDNDRPRPEAAFSVGGTVSGLEGSGLVLHNRTTGEALAAAEGAFEFVQRVPTGLEYRVEVETQPAQPNQICSVARGTGTMGDQAVTDVAVTCVTQRLLPGLDPAFGSGGKVTTDRRASAMALQGDGKLVVAGGATDFTLVRFNADGSPDLEFGEGGVVLTDFAAGQDEAHAIAVQPDGKIVVAGIAVVGRTSNDLFNRDFAVARYRADGELDPTFGTGGKVTTDFHGNTDRAFALALQADGSIVLAGDVAVPDAAGVFAADFGVARYDAAGSLDPSFGGTGKVTTDIGGAVDTAQAIAIAGDGAIVVAGDLTLSGASSLDHTGVARYLDDGALDGSFGAGAGKVVLRNVRVGAALALVSDGAVLLGGHAVAGGTLQFALLRLDTTGAADGAFGSAGLVTTAFTAQNDFGRALAVQPDGAIVLAGQSANSGSGDFAVARYTPDGALDPSFDADGMMTIDFFGGIDGADHVAVQPDGLIVLGGAARNGSVTGYALARVVP